MNKEINKIIANLEGCVGILDYMLTPIESNLLVSYIKELQQENKKYKEVIDKLKEWINIVQQNKDNKHLESFISTDELDELLDILKEVSE